MTVRICSGFSPAGRKQYGERFLTSFIANWPRQVELVVYTEKTDPMLEAMAPGMIRSLWDCRGMKEFLDRHEDDPVANGRQATGRWKPKDRGKPYSFRFDAVKFSRQCFIPEQAATGLTADDILVWMDADVVTHRRVPRGFVEDLVGDADGCYLGRGGKHSEIGFWAVRVQHAGLWLIENLAEAYRSNHVFSQGEWHSAYIWDMCRREAENRFGMNMRNLTPNGHDHVWHQSPLGAFMDHLKGDARKAAGRSAEMR